MSVTVGVTVAEKTMVSTATIKTNDSNNGKTGSRENNGNHSNN
jgi:hypothetical protein